MIQPKELKETLPMYLSNGAVSTTTSVWNILTASRDGNIEKVKELVNECYELIYAQYNYTPPIHFAVREGHTGLVRYLLDHGAHDPKYRIYPFRDSLEDIARDRNYDEIAMMLEDYSSRPELCKFSGDNGTIHHKWTTTQKEFQNAVDKGDLEKTESILIAHAEFVHDENYFWGEGILMMPAKGDNREMITLLMDYGAKVPDVLKWTQRYYFERYDGAAFMMEKGMNPNVMSWHHVTILHDMAQKGNIPKAELLTKYGAATDPLEEEYCSSPLGMAARWGHIEMVEYLLKQGADPNKAAAVWATPLAWARKKGHIEIENILLKAGAR